MARNDASGRVEPACPAVIPLPVALYVSDELIFELYDGGQPARQFSIDWERLKPIAEGAAEKRSQEPRLRPQNDTSDASDSLFPGK
jgi:hypothetical protein